MLEVVGPKGACERFGAGAEAPVVRLRLANPSLIWKLGLYPSLHTGRAYVDGTLILETGTLADLLRILLASGAMLQDTTWAKLLRHLDEIVYAREGFNRIGRAQRNVEHHYDLSEALYDCFLDEDKQSSCANYRSLEDTLAEAQLAKKQHLASKLLLEPGQTVLDIGCGWGDWRSIWRNTSTSR